MLSSFKSAIQQIDQLSRQEQDKLKNDASLRSLSTLVQVARQNPKAFLVGAAVLVFLGSRLLRR